MFQHKFSALETLRKFLADGLFNDPLSRKADQYSRFCKNDIAEHGKACGNPAGRRICKHRKIRQSGLSMGRRSRRSFRHLHQG